MTKVYYIAKFIKTLGGEAGKFEAIKQTAYFDKDVAVARAKELSEKSYNYIYKVYTLEVM